MHLTRGVREESGSEEIKRHFVEMMVFSPYSKVEMITVAVSAIAILSHKHTETDDGGPTGSMKKVGYSLSFLDISFPT